MKLVTARRGNVTSNQRHHTIFNDVSSLRVSKPKHIGRKSRPNKRYKIVGEVDDLFGDRKKLVILNTKTGELHYV